MIENSELELYMHNFQGDPLVVIFDAEYHGQIGHPKIHYLPAP